MWWLTAIACTVGFLFLRELLKMLRGNRVITGISNMLRFDATRREAMMSLIHSVRRAHPGSLRDPVAIVAAGIYIATRSDVDATNIARSDMAADMARPRFLGRYEQMLKAAEELVESGSLPDEVRYQIEDHKLRERTARHSRN